MAPAKQRRRLIEDLRIQVEATQFEKKLERPIQRWLRLEPTFRKCLALVSTRSRATPAFAARLKKAAKASFAARDGSDAWLLERCHRAVKPR